MTRKTAAAFSLVELLVVITIIVVLLSLLAPALDKVFYEANMAVCGATKKSLGTSLAAYAAGFRRSYPDRPDTQSTGNRPHHLNHGDTAGVDDRFSIRGQFTTDLFLDPFVEPLRLDIEETKPTSHTYSNYSLWYGLQFTSGGGSGLLKIGDRLYWGGNRFAVLAADKDAINEANRIYLGTHPDDEGLAQSVWGQDSGGIEGTPGLGGINANWTFSRWQASGSPLVRGRIDRSFLYTDISVTRINAIKPLNDGRLVVIPEFMAGATTADPAQWRAFLPAESRRHAMIWTLETRCEWMQNIRPLP